MSYEECLSSEVPLQISKLLFVIRQMSSRSQSLEQVVQNFVTSDCDVDQKGFSLCGLRKLAGSTGRWRTRVSGPRDQTVFMRSLSSRRSVIDELLPVDLSFIARLRHRRFASSVLLRSPQQSDECAADESRKAMES